MFQINSFNHHQALFTCLGLINFLLRLTEHGSPLTPQWYQHLRVIPRCELTGQGSQDDIIRGKTRQASIYTACDSQVTYSTQIMTQFVPGVRSGCLETSSC